MRNRFDLQLIQLNEELTEMGARCENAIATATKALFEGDILLAEKAIEAEIDIDRMENQIESLCMRLLLQQQPVAKDLRLISAALKMITDMERIGDQAADIAEIMTMANIKPTGDIEHIDEMARSTINMVTDSIEAFVKKDIDMARSVIEADDKVDELFNHVKTEIVRLLKKDNNASEYALDLLMIAKYFERIGDHATNIAEWVEYSITGIHRKEI
ncbi:MAG: phosphate signaling complex protein PhoU [Oscillospiraceae bacterium]